MCYTQKQTFLFYLKFSNYLKNAGVYPQVFDTKRVTLCNRGVCYTLHILKYVSLSIALLSADCVTQSAVKIL